jgi:hypothetical protein
MKKLESTKKTVIIQTVVACAAIVLFASCQSDKRGGQGGPGEGGGKPDITAAATKLGVTEDQVKAALGDPNQGPPNFAKAAKALGITEKQLMEALGTSQGKRPSK